MVRKYVEPKNQWLHERYGERYLTIWYVYSNYVGMGHTFSFSILPPGIAGIYALVNHKRHLIYIGKTTNLMARFCSWGPALHGHVPVVSVRMLAEIEAGPDGWEFAILFLMPGATGRELGDAEARAIAFARIKYGDGLLNKATPSVGGPKTPAPKRTLHPDLPKPIKPKRAVGRPTKTSILDETGLQVSYETAAKRLSVSVKTIYTRLYMHRCKGVTEVTLQDLKALTDMYRTRKSLGKYLPLNPMGL